MAKSTMKPISFNTAGMFGQKPRIHPVLSKMHEDQERAKELEKQAKSIKTTPEVKQSQNNADTSLEINSFMCTNCDKEFSDKRKLNGHMLKYTKNKKK